jgi:threonine dehydrogenase-like Zn-dependent dehydrogenase
MTFQCHGKRLLAAAFALAACTAVHAQGTTASIFGQGPAGATVIAQSTTGAKRHITISDSGHYRLSPVPMGTYSVRIEKDDKVLDTRSNITVTVGRGAEIDFACENDKCGAGEG